MASAGSQARLLIGLSLGKICRGGGGLRRNLMVATVLQKARLVFVEEAELARRPVTPDSKECRVNAPDAPVSDKSENKVPEQSTVLCDDANSRLREEPSSARDEVGLRNSAGRSAGVKRPREERQEVKRVKYSAGCRPPPARAPHLLPIAV